jgi:hypothetical protein
MVCCRKDHFRSWHFSDLSILSKNVGYEEQSRSVVDVAQTDPIEGKADFLVAGLDSAGDRTYTNLNRRPRRAGIKLLVKPSK